jgi:hypothetical protein
MYTTQDVKDLIGVSDSTLSGWISSNYLTPTQAGSPGYRTSHLFSERQIVALVIFDLMRRTDRGCEPRFLKSSLIPHVTALPARLFEQWLQGEANISLANPEEQKELVRRLKEVGKLIGERRRAAARAEGSVRK